MNAPAHGEHYDPFAAKLGMWLFLVTEILLFGGLFIAYSYMRARYPHEFHHAGGSLSIPIGVANTAVLLTSSLTMVLAVAAAHRGNLKRSLLLTWSTVALGGLFLVNKGFEWAAKFHHGVYPNSDHMASLPAGERVFFGLYFSMTGLHAVHVIAGMAVLSVLAILIAKGRIGARNPVVLENGGLYWHLVDVVWIYLLPLFYLAA
ncbi:MAG: cytochrome c oxidase subunit 3 family protein [Acidobacteriota bacterium]